MLTGIVGNIRKHVDACKLETPLGLSSCQPGNFAFRKAISAANWSLIAECKLFSPAKGPLCPNRTVPDLAIIFSNNGASALSVHTSCPFGGKLADIAEVRAVSPLPILRKDFIIDEYQIYESRSAGADAILLIAAILDDIQLDHFLAIAARLGLDCLVEIHSLPELERVRNIGATLVGINNRDLNTFNTDIANTLELLPHCDPRWQIISESGINNVQDANQLKNAGVAGILVGEGLVKAPDIGEQTRLLAGPG